MTRRALINLALAGLAAASLTGCQLDYRVYVTAENGQLIFKTIWKRLGPDKPASVERLEVVEHTKNPRTAWEVESVATNGRELGELRYAQLPDGFRQKVAPQRLKVGQIYTVRFWGPGGSGQSHFAITRYDLGGDITMLHE